MPNRSKYFTKVLKLGMKKTPAFWARVKTPKTKQSKKITAKFLGKADFLKGQLFVNHLPFSLFFSLFFPFFFSISISILYQCDGIEVWRGCKVSPYPQKTAFFVSHSGQGLCNSAKRVMRLGVSAFSAASLRNGFRKRQGNIDQSVAALAFPLESLRLPSARCPYTFGSCFTPSQGNRLSRR